MATEQARAGSDAAVHEAAGVDEQPGADALLEAVFLEVADFLGETGEGVRARGVDAALPPDDLSLHVLVRVVELHGDEALTGGLLEVLEGALIAGVVRDDEQEAIGGGDDLTPLLDGQQAAVVGEGVE